MTLTEGQVESVVEALRRLTRAAEDRDLGRGQIRIDIDEEIEDALEQARAVLADFPEAVQITQQVDLQLDKLAVALFDAAPEPGVPPEARHNVSAWLGYWQDQMPAAAAEALRRMLTATPAEGTPTP